MKNQTLIKRYALGFLQSIREDEAYPDIYGQLKELEQTMSSSKHLKDLLTQPFLSGVKKQALADNILNRISVAPKIHRFVSLLIDNDRLDLFFDIVQAMPDIWNEKKGISTFEVTSAVLLTDDQKERLLIKLEKLENRPVTLKYRQDPSLLGGFALRKRNVVYDVSLKGSLENIREQIIEG